MDLQPQIQDARDSTEFIDDEEDKAPSTSKEENHNLEETPGVKAALTMLRFYKNAISPLLQPACRFIPTCSAYSIDAYKTHGVAKGTILTAWRLARCNPFGGKGYDPVQWPPPGLEWMFTD